MLKLNKGDVVGMSSQDPAVRAAISQLVKHRPALRLTSSKMTPMSHNAFKIRPQTAVWQCDRMPSQIQWLSGVLYSYHGAAGYGLHYLFAPVHHGPLSG